MKTNTIPIRTDKKYVDELKDMQLKRILTGKDEPMKPTTSARLSLAITRHNLFPQIKKDIIKANLKK